MSVSRNRRLLRGVVASCVVMLFLAPSEVRADNNLVSSDPANGTTYDVAPTTLTMTFTENVDLATITVEIVVANGAPQKLTDPVHGDSDREVRYALPTGLTGVTSLRWRLVHSDGHVMSGRIEFTVTGGGSTATTTSVPTGDAGGDAGGDGTGGTGEEQPDTAGESGDAGMSLSGSAPEIIRWANRAIGYGAMLLLGGLLVAEVFVVSGALFQRRSEMFVRFASTLMFVTPLLQTLMFVGDVRGTSMLGALPSIFSAFDTTPGAMMLMRTILGGVLAYVLMVALPRDASRTLSMLAMFCGGLYLFTLSYAGHSRSMGAPWLGIPLDMVHTAAAVTWLGGLIALLLVVLPMLSGDRAIAAFHRFSTIAQRAVGVLIVTGAIQAVRLHTGITTLFTTSHGRLLILKIALVAGMLRIGDLNRQRLSRRRGADPSGRVHPALLRASMTEALIGCLVVATTAALVTASF